MNTFVIITEKELMQKIEDGVSRNVVWQKPLLLLTKDGSDYNYMLDSINEKYRTSSIVTEPQFCEFVRVGDKLEMFLNGEMVDGHHPEVDMYDYLGGPLGYGEKIHRYCAALVEYEAKPVISFICVADNNCSVEDIPGWMKEQFEIVMLKLDFSSYGDK